MSLVIKNISKSFSNCKILEDISLEVKVGELATLIGSSGAGKSTLLRIIAGLEPLDQGQIYLNGSDLGNLPPYQRNIAMLFQQAVLFPHLSVKNNLLFPLRGKKIPRLEMEKRIEEVARLLDISSLLERFPKNLSGGEQQRASLGRILVRKPNLILLDEPFSHLDFPLQYSLRQEIQRLPSHLQIPILYVTHDQQEALSLGTKVGILNKCRLEQWTCPKDLYYKPRSLQVAQFVGAPPINLIPGEIKENTFSSSSFPPLLLTETCQQQSWIEKEKVLFAIRPEKLILGKTGVKVTIDSVEFWGATSVLHLRFTDGSVLLAITDNKNQEYSPGESWAVQINPKDGIFFASSVGNQ